MSDWAIWFVASFGGVVFGTCTRLLAYRCWLAFKCWRHARWLKKNPPKPNMALANLAYLYKSHYPANYSFTRPYSVEKPASEDKQ